MKNASHSYRATKESQINSKTIVKTGETVNSLFNTWNMTYGSIEILI
jgi:hypothetical protein